MRGYKISANYPFNNLNNCPNPMSSAPNITPTTADTTITSIVNRVACSRFGHTTLLSSPIVCLKKPVPKLLSMIYFVIK